MNWYFKLWKWLKPQYHESIVLTFPENIPQGEWVTAEANLEDLKFRGVFGRYHKTGIFTTQLNVTRGDTETKIAVDETGVKK
jgi:hypothetical protein